MHTHYQTFSWSMNMLQLMAANVNQVLRCISYCIKCFVYILFVLFSPQTYKIGIKIMHILYIRYCPGSHHLRVVKTGFKSSHLL